MSQIILQKVPIDSIRPTNNNEIVIFFDILDGLPKYKNSDNVIVPFQVQIDSTLSGVLYAGNEVSRESSENLYFSLKNSDTNSQMAFVNNDDGDVELVFFDIGNSLVTKYTRAGLTHTTGDGDFQTKLSFQTPTQDSEIEIRSLSGIMAITDDFKFTSNIPVILGSSKSFGKYTNGQVIPASGKTLHEVIIDAVSELFPPTMTSSINQNSTNLEIGETVNVTITTNYTQNDGGTPSISVRRNGVQIGTTNSVVNSGNLLSATPIQFQSIINYTAGNLPNSGILLGNMLNLRGYYKIFYGSNNLIPASSATVRSLPFNRTTAQANTFILDSGTIHNKQYIVLDPYSTLNTVIDLDALNTDITSEYVLSGTISVNDANGVPIPNYKIYERVQAVPYTTNHRHQITKTTSTY